MKRYFDYLPYNINLYDCKLEPYIILFIILWFVGGAAGAVSRITGAMGKGIAALTLDDDYQKKRREAMNKRPANVREGFARGGKGLVMVSLEKFCINK